MRRERCVNTAAVFTQRQVTSRKSAFLPFKYSRLSLQLFTQRIFGRALLRMLSHTYTDAHLLLSHLSTLCHIPTEKKRVD